MQPPCRLSMAVGDPYKVQTKAQPCGQECTYEVYLASDCYCHFSVLGLCWGRVWERAALLQCLRSLWVCRCLTDSFICPGGLLKGPSPQGPPRVAPSRGPPEEPPLSLSSRGGTRVCLLFLLFSLCLSVWGSLNRDIETGILSDCQSPVSRPAASRPAALPILLGSRLLPGHRQLPATTIHQHASP